MSTTYSLRPEVIDTARKRTGCTSDAALAEHLNISPSTISHIRAGGTPTFKTGIRLLDAAGVGIGGIRKTTTKTTKDAA